MVLDFDGGSVRQRGQRDVGTSKHGHESAQDNTPPLNRW